MRLVRTSLLGAGLAAGFAGLVLMIALGDGGFVIVCVAGFVLVLAGVVLPHPGAARRSRQQIDDVNPFDQYSVAPPAPPAPEPAAAPPPQAQEPRPQLAPQPEPGAVAGKPAEPAVQAKPPEPAPTEVKPPEVKPPEVKPAAAAPHAPEVIPTAAEALKPANVPLPDPPAPDGVDLLVGRATQVAGSPAVVAGIAALSAGAVVLARRLMRR